MAFLSTRFDALLNTPPATRVIAGLILVSSLGYQYLSYTSGIVPPATTFPYILLVPGSVIYYPWTIISSVFVEASVLELLFSLIFVFLSLRHLERLWGTFETVKFVLVTCGVSNVLALFINYVEFMVIGREEIFLYGMYYRGLMALQAGCLVAFTQIIPEHQIQLLGVFKVRIKRLPMIYVGFSNVMCILGYQSPYILIQWGWLASWTYLRFYKKTSIEGVTMSETWGDRSETFAFVHWFPPFVHQPLGKVCDVVYNGAVALRLVRPYPSGDLEAGTYAPLPLAGGNARAEAERRRAMALKALDQRVASTAAAGSKAQRAATQQPAENGAGSSSAKPEAQDEEPPTRETK
ncbi:hypothetical protein FRB99_003450 [Tulasnella sp. 403]|nr:hypothetical protein FRB99_003450 [Tulasnella sp. 403]